MPEAISTSIQNTDAKAAIGTAGLNPLDPSPLVGQPDQLAATLKPFFKKFERFIDLAEREMTGPSGQPAKSRRSGGQSEGSAGPTDRSPWPSFSGAGFGYKERDDQSSGSPKKRGGSAKETVIQSTVVTDLLAGLSAQRTNRSRRPAADARGLFGDQIERTPGSTYNPAPSSIGQGGWSFDFADDGVNRGRKRPMDWRKRVDGWRRRAGQSASGWGRNATGWGSRVASWGRHAASWGQSAAGWGQRAGQSAAGWGRRAGQSAFGHGKAAWQAASSWGQRVGQSARQGMRNAAFKFRNRKPPFIGPRDSWQNTVRGRTRESWQGAKRFSNAVNFGRSASGSAGAFEKFVPMMLFDKSVGLFSKAAAGFGFAAGVIKRGIQHAEGQNAHNQRFAGHNQNIGVAFNQLSMNDMKRNMKIGRDNEGSIVRLTRSVDAMRSAWVGFDSMNEKVNNRIGIVGSEVGGTVGRLFQQPLDWINRQIEAADPGGANTQGTAQWLSRNLHGAVAAFFTNPFGSATTSFNEAYAKELDAQRKAGLPALDSWAASLHELTNIGPFINQRPVPAFPGGMP
jgi:hypothetical protein